MIDCQVFVELGMTKPKSKVHSSNARPYKKSIRSSHNQKNNTEILKYSYFKQHFLFQSEILQWFDGRKIDFSRNSSTV